MNGRVAGFDAAAVRAVAFDYGNTLVPFGVRAANKINSALAAVLAEHYGPVDYPRLEAIRARDRMRPYGRGCVENDLGELCTGLVRELYGRSPSPAAVDDLLRARFDAFLAAVEPPDGVRSLLEHLAGRYSLGLVSNYPDGQVLRASLERVGLHDLFRSVVVSGDVGYCKPDPRPFLAVADQLNAAPETMLFVGDNWLADIQGAKRQGMKAALITQYSPLDEFDRGANDHEPDLVIAHLDELAEHLPV